MSLYSPSPIFPTALADSGQALGPATDRAEAGESTFRLVDSTLGVSATSARLLMIDPAGRLRLVSERRDFDDVGRKRSARRREAVSTSTTRVIRLRRPAGDALAIVPLVSRGEVLGVLEVAAPAPLIDVRLDELEAIGAQTAIALRSIGLIEEARRHADAMAGVAGLMGEHLAVSSSEHAVRRVVRFCWDTFERPVAGWLRAAEGEGSRLIASRGIGRDTRNVLKRWDGERRDADAIVRAGIEVLGEAAAIVTSARNAVVLVGGAPRVDAGLVDAVAAALSLVLDRLALRTSVQELAGSLDTGLAWTAHEMRAPLIGVEKVIDRVAAHDRVDDLDRQLLGRAQAELRRLTVTVDDLLRWSVATASIKRRRTDLTRLVAETLRSLPVEESGRRVNVDLPETAVVRVDPMLLRIAVENLVRNSLQHGSDDVEVSLELTGGNAMVSVSDRGPGVPPGDRVSIFEPFVRGRRAVGGGRGLGLFIAKRVVQAHDGTLWLEEGLDGTVFRMRIPAGAA